MPAISYSILTQGHDKHRRCYSLSPRMLVENIFKHQEFVKRADICALQQWDLHKNINMLRFSDAMAGCGIIFMWVQQIHELHQTSIPVPFVIHVLYYCLHPPPPFRASFLPIKGGLSHFITFPSQFCPGTKSPSKVPRSAGGWKPQEAQMENQKVGGITPLIFRAEI